MTISPLKREHGRWFVRVGGLWLYAGTKAEAYAMQEELVSL